MERRGAPLEKGMMKGGALSPVMNENTLEQS